MLKQSSSDVAEEQGTRAPAGGLFAVLILCLGCEYWKTLLSDAFLCVFFAFRVDFACQKRVGFLAIGWSWRGCLHTRGVAQHHPLR